MALAPSPEGSQPQPLDLGPEALQTVPIPWDTVVIVMPLYDLLEPRSLLGNRGMTPTPQGRFDRLKLLTHPFDQGSAFDREPVISATVATDMHKPQKRKRLWLAHSSLLPALGRKAAELKQACFERVQGEAKGAESLG